MLFCINLAIHNYTFYVIELFGFPLTLLRWGFIIVIKIKDIANRVGERFYKPQLLTKD